MQHLLIKWFLADFKSSRHSHILDCIRSLVTIREISRHKVKAVKLLRVFNFAVSHHVSEFKKVAGNAKRAAAIDFNTRISGLCGEASSVIDTHNMKQFCRLKRIFCPKQPSPLVAFHVDDKILPCFSNVEGAFLKHFASALAGSEVDAASSFE